VQIGQHDVLAIGAFKERWTVAWMASDDNEPRK